MGGIPATAALALARLSPLTAIVLLASAAALALALAVAITLALRPGDSGTSARPSRALPAPSASPTAEPGPAQAVAPLPQPSRTPASQAMVPSSPAAVESNATQPELPTTGADVTLLLSVGLTMTLLGSGIVRLAPRNPRRGKHAAPAVWIGPYARPAPASTWFQTNR